MGGQSEAPEGATVSGHCLVFDYQEYREVLAALEMMVFYDGQAAASNCSVAESTAGDDNEGGTGGSVASNWLEKWLDSAGMPADGSEKLICLLRVFYTLVHCHPGVLCARPGLRQALLRSVFALLAAAPRGSRAALFREAAGGEQPFERFLWELEREWEDACAIEERRLLLSEIEL